MFESFESGALSFAVEASVSFASRPDADADMNIYGGDVGDIVNLLALRDQIDQILDIVHKVVFWVRSALCHY